MAGPGDVPVYESSQRIPAGPERTVQPIAASVADTSAIGKAVAEFGAAGVDYASKLKHAQGETQDAGIKTEYLTQVAGLRDKYANSEDFQNAPGQFADDHLKLKADLLAGVNDPLKRAQLGLYFAVHGLEAEKAVKNNALKNEGDFNIAGLNDRSAEYVRKAASAGSPDERKGILETYNSDIDKQVAAGWISRHEGVRRKVTTGQTLDDADALALIRMNPRQALEELQNPERFKNLGPVQRENLVNQAKAQQDQVATLQIQNMAKRDPVRASAIVGRVGAVSEADGVFDRGIIPIESEGKHDAVSPAGALGLTQIMPDTARAVARQLGLDDVAGLSDEALRARLLDKNDPLNRQLGMTYWRSMVGRYEGNIYAAAAAYNAGPGNDKKPRADAWVAEATRRYGPGFSPAELAEVIPIKETKDYVLKLAARLGAPAGGSGLSAAGSYHAAAAVSGAISGQESERIGAIKAIAQVARETDDPATIFRTGFDVDPARYAGWKQRQTDAAMAGDMTAAKALREAEFQREMLPFRQQSLRTPPAQLEALVANETARLSSAPNVTIDEKNRLDVARETLKAVHEARKTNIIGLAEQAQLVPADQRVAIDAKADPGTQDFGRALARRGAQANGAARFYGGSAIAFKPEELDGLKERWNNGSPEEQFRLLQSFGRHLDGQAYVDTLGAVIGNDPNAETIGRVARDRPELARDILIGAKLMGSKEVADKAALVRPALAAKLGGEIYPDPEMQNSVVNAALALYTARRATSGALYDPTDGDGVGKAIEEITGPIVKRNGARTPIAPGLAPRDFHDTLDRLTDAQVTTMGGAYGRNARPFSAAEISDRGQLVPTAPGAPTYGVKLPTPDGKGAPLLTYDGTPLIFDMRTLAASRTPQPLTPYQKGQAASRGGAWERLRQANEDAQP